MNTSSTNSKFISVIVPAYNESDFIAACLESLVNQDYPKDSFEIIVVDNGSEDTTVAIAQQYANKVLELTEGNVGAVRNYGVKQAKSDILVFLDSDCTVNKEWLRRGVQKLLSERRSAIGGVLSYSNPNANWIQKYWVLSSDEGRAHQSDLMGSCIFISREDFERVGGFNEEVTSGEDTELSVSLRKQGIKIEIDPSLTIYHLDTPDTAGKFMRRQAWHSENYFVNFKSTLKDKMFYFIVSYLILSLYVLYSIVSGNITAIVIAHQLFPLLLTAKRIKRSNYKIRNASEVLLVLAIDNLYLLGRSIGLLRGFRKVIL